MKKNNPSIRILFLHDSHTETERVADNIKKHGNTLITATIQHCTELSTQLNDTTWDLVIYLTWSKLTSISTIAQIIQQSKKTSPPLLIINRIYDRQQALQQKQEGASSVIAYQEIDELMRIFNQFIDNGTIRKRTKLLERHTLSYKAQFLHLLESSNDAIAYLQDGIIIKANQQFLTQFAFNHSADLDAFPILDLISEKDRTAFREVLNSISKNYASKSANTPESFTFLLNNKQEKTLNVKFSPSACNGDNYIQMTAKNANTNAPQITTQAETKGRAVTLYQRKLLLTELNKIIAQPDNNGLLFFVEIDNFSRIKESISIAESDNVLHDIFLLLYQSYHHNSIISRLSSDVIAILTYPNTNNDIENISINILKLLGNYQKNINNSTVTLTCSIGAISLTNVTSTDIALSRTDVACAIARTEGGNKAHIYNVDLDNSINQKITTQWMADIQEALTNDSFRLVFQPIVNLHANPEEKYEVLVRLKSPQGEEISPSQFLLAAQHAKLTHELDKWIIENAIQHLQTQHTKHGKSMCFFIKLTTETILEDSFLTWLESLFKKYATPTQSVVFEINENDIMHHFQATRKLIDRLNEIGCLIALEHIGAHATSFNCIQQLNVQFLKIAGSLVSNIMDNRKGQIMIRQIIEIASKFDKYTIAGFVQDADSLAYLWQEGVNYIQGYYLQPPEASLRYDFSGQA